jgi:hypothetical protein
VCFLDLVVFWSIVWHVMFNFFLIYNFWSFCILPYGVSMGQALNAHRNIDMHSLGLHYLDIINSLQLMKGNRISPNILIKSSHNISWFDVICLKFGVSNLFPKVFLIAPHFIAYPLSKIVLLQVTYMGQRK